MKPKRNSLRFSQINDRNVIIQGWNGRSFLWIEARFWSFYVSVFVSVAYSRTRGLEKFTLTLDRWLMIVFVMNYRSFYTISVTQMLLSFSLVKWCRWMFLSFTKNNDKQLWSNGGSNQIYDFGQFNLQLQY